MVTPMRTDGSLCLKTVERLVEFHCENGTDGLVLAGTTGESCTLLAEERQQLIATGVRAANGALPIIAGTGTSDTATSIELSLQAQAEGADACMLAVPAYNRPPQEGLYRHFTAIADAISVPVMLYNVPHRTACDLQTQTVHRLSAHPRILALKDSLGAERFGELSQQLQSEVAAGFRLYSGSDDLLLESLDAGATGIVSVSANLVPAQVREVCSLHVAGKRDEAAEAHERLLPLHRALFVESSPIAVKWAMQQTGLLDGADGIRLPLVPASDITRGELSPLLDTLTVRGRGGLS